MAESSRLMSESPESEKETAVPFGHWVLMRTESLLCSASSAPESGSVTKPKPAERSARRKIPSSLSKASSGNSSAALVILTVFSFMMKFSRRASG